MARKPAEIGGPGVFVKATTRFGTFLAVNKVKGLCDTAPGPQFRYWIDDAAKRVGVFVHQQAVKEARPLVILSRGNILVVDDEVNLCRILDAKLTKSGYQVVTVHDGLQAVEKVQERQFDLVLLDLILPKLDGLEALEKIRKINAELPVIIMTACENTDAVTRARSQGAAAFVSKPFDLDRLVMLVQNTSSEGRSISSETTVMDGSGIFRKNQILTIEAPEQGAETVKARLEERTDATLSLALLDASQAGLIPASGDVQVYIPAPDALYRFTTAVLGNGGDGCVALSLPQLMYRVQRRKSPRLGLKAPITCREPGARSQRKGYTEDIGLEGMSIVIPAEVAPGKTLKIESGAVLHLDSVRCAGEVLRCEPVHSGGRDQWKVALKFTEPDPNLRRAILQHLALSG
mgnify:FL=1|jgi:DNA-binding response OmpR family regulator